MKTFPANEITFIVEQAPEGGFTAQALGHSIFSEADTWDALQINVQDALRCHFGDGDALHPRRLISK